MDTKVKSCKLFHQSKMQDSMQKMGRICILSKLSCYQLKRDNDYYYYWIFNASLMEFQLKTYSRYTEEKGMGIKTYHYKNDQITNLA